MLGLRTWLKMSNALFLQAGKLVFRELAPVLASSVCGGMLVVSTLRRQRWWILVDPWSCRQARLAEPVSSGFKWGSLPQYIR